MCGIAGLFSPSADAPRLFERSLLKRMTDAIAHRGPDDEGFLSEPHVALGHRRLSIIDIASGHQPMFNEDESVAVVFNGEIYNYRDLANELEAAADKDPNLEYDMIGWHGRCEVHEKFTVQDIDDVRAQFRARYSSGRKMIRWAPSEATTSAALPLVQQMSVSALTSAYVFT